jgi:hypothetical protein
MFEKEGFADMYKIVCSMISRPESMAFREPVQWKLLGLIDYLDVIKQPMDLGTIKIGIEKRKYETLADIAYDVRLVWRNCMTYNRDGSEVSFEDLAVPIPCYCSRKDIFFTIRLIFCLAFL